MDSFFLYRKPGESDFIGACGNSFPGLRKGGFVISPFYHTSDSISTIIGIHPVNLDNIPLNLTYDELFDIPEESTPRERHCEVVRNFIAELGYNEKAVACRTICGRYRINLKKSLLSLSDRYPDAMVFCFHTPASGTWIGATPELLLSSHGSCLQTMALAGTRISTSTEAWDDKNLKEQRLVSDYIIEILNNNGYKDFTADGPHSHSIGKLQHLLTKFSINLPTHHSLEDSVALLFDLSPTPALCGLPKEKAFDLIYRYEDFSRGYYGGFCGPVDISGDFDLYVILRSIRISADHWVMYAGGGITSESDPLSEWIETERKAASILDCLKFDNKEHNEVV